MSIADFARYYRSYLQHTQEVIYTDKALGLCKGEQGWYIKHSMGPYSTVAAEDVFVASDGYVYVARYIYPSKWSALPAGEVAVRSLCLKAPPRAIVVHLPARFAAAGLDSFAIHEGHGAISWRPCDLHRRAELPTKTRDLD